MNKIIAFLVVLIFIVSLLLIPSSNNFLNKDHQDLDYNKSSNPELIDKYPTVTIESEKTYIDDESRGGDNSISGKYSPLEHTRISKYESHMLTEQEVTSLKEKVGVRDKGKKYNVLFNGFGTGLSPPTDAQWNAMVGNIEVVDAALGAGLPSSLDHSTSNHFPPVRSQGSQGSCAAWATTYYAATYVQSKDNNWTLTSSGNNNQIMSPAWTYNKANFGYDSGSWTWNNYYVLRDVGGVTWTTMPYTSSDLLNWGNESCWREAPKYRYGTMKWTYPKEIEVLKSWLSDGYVLPMALHASQYSTGLGSGDNIITSTEYNRAGANHANTIVGYDDNKVEDGEIGAFKIVNSWGAGWGSSWSGNGYYWMTYKAFAELTSPVIMFYDKIDYEPKLLATWNITGTCSRGADIYIGIGNVSSPYDTVEPYMLGYSSGRYHSYPNFMCLDITEFKDSLGLTSFFIEIDSNPTNGSISSFKLEYYKNNYKKFNPSQISEESNEVPKTNPCFVNNSLNGYQIKIETPKNNDWYRGTIQASGSANQSVTKTVIFEDFEGLFPYYWEVNDSDDGSGSDYWGISNFRKDSGFISAWCAGVKEPLFEEDFDDTLGSIPDGWATHSNGPDNHKWNVSNKDYRFVYDGDDYGAVCDSSESGPGTDITEWLYMNKSFNASEYSYIYLDFFLDYKYGNGSEYAQVLYSNGSLYPKFYNLKNYTSETYGQQWLNLSTVAGEEDIYLAFRYHGTNDSYMFVDDVKVISRNTTNNYENNMSSYMIQLVDLTDFEFIEQNYDYWLDSETNYDSLYAIYYSGGSWYYVDEHNGSSSGWNKSSVIIPNSSTYVGFHFDSDSTVSNYEGAYIDNVELIGYNNLSSVHAQIDTGSWNTVTGSNNWGYTIDTTSLTDGVHEFNVRAKYGSNYSFDKSPLRVDNTIPSSFSPTANPSGWTSNNQPVVTFSTTDTTSGISHYSLRINTGSFNNQTSPYTLPQLSDGTHTITVRAFDLAGNYRDEVVNVYIDTNQPNTFSVIANPSGWTNNTQPVITFFTTDSPSGIDKYELKIDLGTFSEQTSPYILPSQVDGSHNISVRAYDLAGNYRESFTDVFVDTTPPLSFIPTATPSGWSPITQPNVTFTTTDSTSGMDYYEVKIDNGSFSTQSNPYKLPIQSDGIHNVTVRAYDRAGNYFENYVFVYIDTTLPNPFTPVATPGSWTPNTQPTITFSTTDDNSGIDNYEVKIDNGAYVSQTSPYKLPVQTEGVHTITVRAFNKAGKYIDGTVNIYIDTSKPKDFTPMANPNTWTNTQPEISFSTTDDVSGIHHYEVKIADGNFFSQGSPYTIPQLDDGVYQITIWAIDKAGNYNDGFTNVYLDFTSPEPFKIIANPDTWTTNVRPVIQFTTNDLTSGIDRFEVSIDFSVFSTQTSPYKLPELTDGVHNITVLAYDNAGNTMASYQEVYIDTTPPNPFTPKATPESWTNNTQPIISFSTIDNSSGIARYELKIDYGIFSTQTSPCILPNLDDGIYEITVRAYDIAGNYRDEVVNVYIDTQQPEEFVPGTKVNGWTNNTQPEIRFSTVDKLSGIDHYEVKVGPGIFIAQVSPYTLPPLVDGKQSIFVRAYDKAGNYYESSIDVYIDSTPPSNLSIVINNGSKVTNSTTVYLDLHANDLHSGVAQMAFSNDGKTWSSWEPFVSERYYSLTPISGEKVIYFKVRDLVDNRAKSVWSTIELKIEIQEKPEDNDSDDDGFDDDVDKFPMDPNEWLDSDGDGVGDNADMDDDDDGFIDSWEEYLQNDPKKKSSKPLDSDNDGEPDGDSENTQKWMDYDDDNDGYSDKAEQLAGSDPLDSENIPQEGEKSSIKDTGYNLNLIIILIIVIIIIVIIVLYSILRKKPITVETVQPDEEKYFEPSSSTPEDHTEDPYSKWSEPILKDLYFEEGSESTAIPNEYEVELSYDQSIDEPNFEHELQGSEFEFEPVPIIEPEPSDEVVVAWGDIEESINDEFEWNEE